MRYGSRRKKLKLPRFPSFWFAPNEGSPEAHWVDYIVCYNGGGSESPWPFLRLCTSILWVKKGHFNCLSRKYFWKLH